ncbi:hypothetical protein ACQY0O_006176 [Thecaphora frezii]
MHDQLSSNYLTAAPLPLSLSPSLPSLPSLPSPLPLSTPFLAPTSPAQPTLPPSFQLALRCIRLTCDPSQLCTSLAGTMSTSPYADAGAGPSQSASPPPLERKRHHLDPHEQQARQLEKLLAHPQKEIKVPSLPKQKTLRPPRDIQKNVVGSSAGAGSGEFHVYKQARRREYERIRLMEEGAQKIVEADEFARRQAAIAQQDEAKTNKNRSKRGKKKLAALKARAAAKGQDPSRVRLPASGGGDNDADGREDDSKRRRIHNEAAGSILFKPRDSDEDQDQDEGDNGAREEDETPEAGDTV